MVTHTTRQRKTDQGRELENHVQLEKTKKLKRKHVLTYLESYGALVSYEGGQGEQFSDKCVLENRETENDGEVDWKTIVEYFSDDMDFGYKIQWAPDSVLMSYVF